MKGARVDLRRVVPTQCVAFVKNLIGITADFKPRKLKPLPVIKDEELFLLGDGHHRAVLFYLHFVSSGLEHLVPIEIAENRDEIKRLFAPSYKGYDFDEFKSVYSLRNEKNRQFFRRHVEEVELDRLNSGVCAAKLRVEDRRVIEPNYSHIDIFNLPDRNKIESALSLYTRGYPLR